MNRTSHEQSSWIVFITQPVLPVAFVILSTTFGWLLLFFASFSKYSTTFIRIRFVWLLRRFPWKDWEEDSPSLERLFALKIAAELDDAISFTLKGKHVNYIIARYCTHIYEIYYAMTNWWSLWTWTASWTQFQGHSEREHTIAMYIAS